MHISFYEKMYFNQFISLNVYSGFSEIRTTDWNTKLNRAL